jgi:p-aminobenzoyl-glutamate transporter AbgT
VVAGPLDLDVLAALVAIELGRRWLRGLAAAIATAVLASLAQLGARARPRRLDVACTGITNSAGAVQALITSILATVW